MKSATQFMKQAAIKNNLNWSVFKSKSRV